MKRAAAALAVLFLAVFAATAGASAWSAEPEVAHVSEVSGTVTLTRGGATRPVALGETLALSDIVEVGTDGALEIAFEDGSTAEADAGTRLRIAALAPNLRGIGLERGAIRSLVERRRGVSYEIRTPVATAGVRGTDFGVEYPGGSDDAEAEVDVFEGEVEVEPGSGTAWGPQRIRAGESARARLRQALRKRRIPEERRAAWEARRTRLRERIEERIRGAIEAGRSREEIYRHLPPALQERFRDRAGERFDRARQAVRERVENRREDRREPRRPARERIRREVRERRR